jgi:hypothetical protein
MKTTASASPSGPQASRPAATTVAATATPPSASRPTAPVDYRANVERQTREQKSVGNILAYIVYGFLALFLVTAALAGYGGYTLTRQLHDQSNTIGELDARYDAANKDLAAKLAVTRDTLQQAQAQIARQQDLIVKQQEDLNRLLSATTANDAALKAEKAARLQENTILRSRLHELDVRTTPAGTSPKF